jgi:DNA-binding response OmpR family regulator
MSGNKILIVDDDRDLLHGMNIWLRSQGFKVVFAVDATSAVVMATSERPDVIILDISLPGGGGYHVMKSLKSSLPLGSIPVIVITAGDESINRERALTGGAEAFFQKPFNNDELLAAIKKALGREPQETGSENLKGKKILIIDDDKELLQALQIRLKSQGYDVHAAMDGISSIGLALKIKPDLIIIDISLPGGDGYQTMNRLRSLMPLAHVPVFVMTAGNASIHRERAFKAGAEAFFQKPIENTQFLAAIKKAMQA